MLVQLRERGVQFRNSSARGTRTRAPARFQSASGALASRTLNSACSFVRRLARAVSSMVSVGALGNGAPSLAGPLSARCSYVPPAVPRPHLPRDGRGFGSARSLAAAMFHCHVLSRSQDE